MKNKRRKWVEHVLAFVLVITMLLPMTAPISVQAATYKKGSKGTNVKYLQQNISFLGFSTKGADGSFGSNTRNAVLALQKALHIEETGVVDEPLYTLIKETVSGIQQHLKNKGYYSGKVDGIAGEGTQIAFKRIQKDYGYAQTGIADRYVLAEMVIDVEASEVTMKLREWTARINGIYSITLESEYYEKYGEEYIKLFMEYPELLTSDEIFNYFLDYKSSYAKILQEEAKEEYIEASVWEGFINGTEVIVRDVLSKLGIGKDLIEQTTYDSIMALVSNMYYKDSKVFETMKATEEAIKKFGDIYSFAEDSSKLALAREIVKINPELSLAGVEKILDTVTKNWSSISKEISKGITATEYIVAMIQLYAMTGEFMEELQKVVKKPSVLYADIEYLQQEREKDMERFLIEELAAYGIVELVEEALNLATKDIYGMVTDGLDFLSKFTVTASAYDQVYTLLFEGYCDNLKDTISIMRADFSENGKYFIPSEWVEKISNYEAAYSFYLCAIETYYNSVTEIVNSFEKPAVEQLADFLQNYNYDTYIEYCIAKMRNLEGASNENANKDSGDVVARMDAFLQKLEVKRGKNIYCTVNQKACESSWDSGHWCDNCNMRDIVQAKWFKNLFGTVNVDNFPEHDVDASRRDHTGQSCFGFACFAQWYLYADSNTDKVIAERIGTVKFNKSNMEKYVQPGDIVRVNGHSVLVYSIEKDGLMVIDSNWNSGGQLNCLVQKHLLDYNNSRYAGYTAYINRVIGKTEGNSVTSKPDTANKTQYGYYHYTNGAGEYAVCAYHGVEVNGWTNVYREEIWIDEPLSKVASDYRHIRQSGCDEIGCVDSEWKNGNKYVDSNGVVWYCQKTKTVEKNAKEIKNHTVIGEGIGKPKPTTTPKPTVTPVPTEVPTPTPEPVVSGWVKASDCPAGATIVDTKWTYTYTERTEATNATLDGWIRDGERKEVVASGTFDYATFPDTFDTSHTVYTSMYTNKNTVPVADGAVREFISDTPTGYVYWHYSYPVGGGGNAENRIVGYYYNQNLKYVGSWCYATEFCAFKSAKNYTSTANNKEGGGTVYKVTDSDYMKYDVAKGSYWWYRFEYNTCTYQDVKTIYQYYRTSNMESTSEVKEGNGYSNVVKWVRYK